MAMNDVQPLIVIPARGGSKRLPRKNLLPLCGRPMIEWTIKAAKESEVSSRIVVSSDDEEILSIAEGLGVQGLKRPEYLASDTAKTVDVVLDVIRELSELGEFFDAVVLLQPTSPLRAAKDIRQGYELFVKEQARPLVSVCEIDHPVEWCAPISASGYIEGLGILSGARSQDYERRYRLNGAIYISRVDSLTRSRSFLASELVPLIMSKVSSVDVDDEFDFKVCEFLMSEISCKSGTVVDE